MNLKDKINADLKEAMKSGDKIRLQTVRSIRALILEFEKSGANREMTEEDEIKLLTFVAKTTKAEIEKKSNVGSVKSLKKEEAELKIIETYLPEQLSEEEIEEKVKEIAAKVGATEKKDFGKLMGAAMKELKGKADGNLIRKAAEKILS